MPYSDYDLSDKYFQIIKTRTEKEAEDEYNRLKQEYFDNDKQQLSQAREAFVKSEQEAYTQNQTPVKTNTNLLKETSGVLYGGAIKDTIDNLVNDSRHLQAWVMDNITKRILPESWMSESDKAYDAYIHLPDKEAKQYSVLPDVENQTTVGKGARGIANFLAAFLPVEKAIQGASIASRGGEFAEQIIKNAPELQSLLPKLSKTEKFLNTTAASGIATQLTQDPYGERLSDLMEGIPVIGKPIEEFLGANPNDSEAVARFKMALEDAGLGALTDGVIGLAKITKARLFLKKNGGEKALTAFDNTLKEKQSLMGLDEKISNIEDSIAKADSEKSIKTELKYDPTVADELNKAIDSAHKAALEEADKIRPEETVDLLSSQKKPRIIPEDLTGRSPEEIDDIRNYALSRGQQGINEWLDTFTSKQNSVVEAINSGNTEAVAKNLEDLNKIASENNIPNPKLNIDLQFFSESLDKSLREGNIDATTSQLTGLRRLFSDESGQITAEGLKNINPMIAGTAGGGLSGLIVDYNGDGQRDIGDIGLGMLYGFTGSIAIKYGLDAATHSKQKAAAFKAFKEEKLAQFAQYEAKIQDRLAHGNLSDATRLELQNNLDFLSNIKTQIDKVKSYETYINQVKDPRAKARLAKKLEPVIKVNDSSVDDFMNNLQTGELHKSLEVNFDNIDSEEGIKAINEAVYESFGKEIAKAKGGVQGWDVTKDLAADMGISSDVVNQAFKGAEDLHGKALAARITLIASRNKLTSMIKEAIESGTQDSAKTILAIRKQAALHAGLQAEVSGMKSEMGRALNSLKVLSNTTEEFGIKEMDALLNQLGGRESNIKAMQKFLTLNETQQNIFARTMGKNPTLNFFLDWYYSALLSNPATWIVNGISGTLTTSQAIAETAIAERWDQVARLFNPSRESGAYLGEAGIMVQAIRDSIGDALKLAGKSFKEGESQFDSFTKLEADEAIIPQWVENLPNSETIKQGLDFIGNAAHTGSNILQSADDFWKVINHRMSLYREGYRYGVERATAEGLTGQAFTNRVGEYMKEVIDSPSPEIMQRALGFAREQTFNAPLDPDRHILTAAGKSLQDFVNKYPGTRFVFPFLRTPTNIASYVAERTPILNAFSHKFWETMTHGTQAEKDLIKSQMALTSTFIIGVIGLAQAGYITGGGPKDKSAKQVSGWQPYSIKIGDKYFSYNRLDPVAGIFGMTADAFEAISGLNDEAAWDKIAQALIMSSYKNLMSKTYFMQGTQLIDAISSQEPDKLEKIFSNIGAGFIPTVVGTIEKTTNPTYNETFNFLDSIKAKIPGLSNTLPAKRDIFGEPVKAKGWQWAHIINPFAYSEDSNEPARAELGKLKHFSPQTVLSRMKTIDGVELTPEQYDQYIQLMGTPLKEHLNELVKSEEWQGATDGDEDFPGTKQALVKRAISHFKILAKARLLEDNPELNKKVMTRKEQRIQAILGD
jgi:hypothetical protein